MKIASIDKDVKGILSSNYYQIPRFQRPYSWDRENISDFWNDTIVDNESDYFIGSMVVFKVNSDTYGIVDGQQRLTTITMLLSALRNSLNTEGFIDLAKGIHHLIERPNIDNKPQYILSTESSFPYFQEYIQKFGKPLIDIVPGDEEKNIEMIFNQVSELIEGAVKSIKSNPTFDDNAKKENIKEQLILIRDRILGLKLIFVELDEEDDAYIIFETLNTRGKDLSVSDLVKNHFTKLLKPKIAGVDTPKIQWDRILTTIEGSSSDISVDGFLHHFWLSKYDYLTIKTLFKEIKKEVKKHNAQSFLNELEEDSVTYREIHETSYRKWSNEENSIKNALDALSLFRVKQQVPFILAVMIDYKNGKLKKKDVDRILTSIEKFHFIFTAITSQRSSGGISQMYASTARRLTNAQNREDKIEILNEFNKKLRDKTPLEWEFDFNFKKIYLTKNYTKDKNLIKYILSRIDSFSNRSATLDYSLMTIEHIVPQSNLRNNLLPEIQVGQLGNLILVPAELNNELGNKSFVQKKELLIKARVFIDKILEESSTWDSSAIGKRTELLSKIAYKKVWKI
ncbi:MAG: DUF262 domain-containing HNH endonuclease family protein [Syntrophobacterales bacterium]|jgi:uncharacterized protein with ParB-like and HNH nuclease domain|nr:DUF262 domain-containing HNH endonuclease family protein [Syntrophobacterales bacterium]